MEKEYLGDSVYIELTPLGFLLTTENGLPSDPSNQIYIDAGTYGAFRDYVERANAEMEDRPAGTITAEERQADELAREADRERKENV